MSSKPSTDVVSSSDPGPAASAHRERRRLLVIDADGHSATVLKDFASSRGYDTVEVADIASAIQESQSSIPDFAVVVDLDMSTPAAVRLALHFHDVAKVPFVVHSDATDLFDRVIALQLGADNYLPKPMDHRLLIAYIEAAMRRVESNAVRSQRVSIDEFGPYQVNRVSRNVRYQGNSVRLSGAEFELFWLLATHFGEVIDRSQLVAALDLNDDDDIGRAIDQRIFRLRARLSAAGAPKTAIRSVRGKGFVLTGTTAELTSA